MSEQTIFLDENDLLSLLNGGSFHTLEREYKRIAKKTRNKRKEFEERKRKQFENNKLDKE